MYMYYVELASLVVLPSLLPDSRVKVDVTKVIVGQGTVLNIIEC
jgi:hypothetical protein